jgi:hypothetical protein
MIEVLYTDTDRIREALQITVEDLADERFSKGTLELDLMLDLDDWIPAHATIYAAGLGANPTQDQLRQYHLLVAYSTYFCADQTLHTGPLSMPQNISDGKNTIERLDDRQGLVEFIAGRMAKYKNLLTEAVTGSAVARGGHLIGVGSAYDPVTGA